MPAGTSVIARGRGHDAGAVRVRGVRYAAGSSSGSLSRSRSCATGADSVRRSGRRRSTGLRARQLRGHLEQRPARDRQVGAEGRLHLRVPGQPATVQDLRSRADALHPTPLLQRLGQRLYRRWHQLAGMLSRRKSGPDQRQTNFRMGNELRGRGKRLQPASSLDPG